MNIRPKIIFVVLPLITVPLALAAFVSYLSAKSGITTVASNLLQFKSQTLNNYIESQWNLLTSNNLEDKPQYQNAAKEAVSGFARSLIRSPTELIFSIDSSGGIVMTTDANPPKSISNPLSKAVTEIKTPDSALGEKLTDSLIVDKIRRIAYSQYFKPWEWTVYVSEEWNTFYGPVTRNSIIIGIIAALSLSLSLVLLVTATKAVTKPLEGMTKSIEHITQTMNLETQVPILYNDEIGRLAHSFNQMIVNLRKANEDVKSFALRSVIARRNAVKAQIRAEEAKEHEQSLRVLFQKYVPQSIIDKNIERIGKDLLIGEYQQVSILISDIRQFTSITESMEPSQLVDSLNRYFEKMVDIIDKYTGITDKYMGDAIMALFGVPEKGENDILNCVRAGVEMLSRLEIFNEEQEEHKIGKFEIGIGIHYGQVTAGNIGSDKKMDYTVIGEPVNISSRLESLTKHYQIPLIISDKVKYSLGDKLETLLLDKVLVLGSTNPISIFTVAETLGEETVNMWESFEKGQRFYFEGDFSEAKKCFQAAQTKYPDNGLLKVFLGRSNEFLMNSPPNWNGAFRHETK
ncbi:Adenylate cyclase [Olavius algarvensis spirochete endosymbiont]|uniref:adenylate/guanylate cyclase domain-containing protein n=1 Tax=Olavius algarvensis spirochete endosymbiont TaxID=260710 RepID=UPI0006905AD5|nr:adenylate/guanylate cyclase domain-containing protein [Olavius algarvensis spirochete endosymbiont]CAD7845445.1 MAG: Adenylate cyclase (EC 4.6.1.1) [Olavius algarvensis spirochete endosymbiont]VDB01206.1 Adenylate cyclase [Olavius algarvensis spirochete endosymbiont]